MEMEMAKSWIGLMSLAYVAVFIYILILATRFVRAVEKFVEKYNPRS